MATVTFLTDYGPGSEHVGALHAVVVAGCPGADRIDMAHDLPAGDVRFGALVLARMAPLAPPAVHLAVVDPGVGTDRRGIAVRCAGGHAVVGPDNGLLGLVCATLVAEAAVELVSEAHRRRPVAATFHGRDVFAPAAAFLAAGGAIGDLGPALDVASILRPDLPPAEVGPGRLAAIVVGIDRFGNLELLACAADLAAAFPGAGGVAAIAGDVRMPCRIGAVFADVRSAEGLVHADGNGRVAVAVRDGSAAVRLAARVGDVVVIAGG